MTRGPGARLRALLRSGVTSARRAPLRSFVTVACITAGLAPYLAGLGVSRGLLDEAEAAIRDGADLHVSGQRHGRSVALPATVAARLTEVPGVVSVTPRVVGTVRMGRDADAVVLVGIAPGETPPSLQGLRGRWPANGDQLELVLGAPLAARLGLDVGSRIPPFYRSTRGERIATVVGVLPDTAPLWTASMALTSLDAATEIFDAAGQATDFAVRVNDGYEEAVKRRLVTGPPVETPNGPVRLSVVTRPELASWLPRGLLEREGIVSLHFVLVFALGIPLVLVVSGLGLTERRREAGLLRATGWAADELLVRNLAESALLTASGAAAAVLIATVWLGMLGGRGIAGVFLSGVDQQAMGRLPFRLLPEPTLLAVVVAFAVVMTGTLWSSWRATSAPPAEAMR